MRIRKRLLSISAATPPPSSDPHLPPLSSDHAVSSGTGSEPLARKERILGAKTSNVGSTSSLPPPLPTSHLVLKGWFEGDRLIPVKKRRGSFAKRVNNHVEEKTKLKTDEDKCFVTEEVSATDVKRNKKKKKDIVKRGNVIMEGSRCSRVNGRGWRCCQQTLVGYSLCEHHLGKGRVRSLTSVRGQNQRVAPKLHKVEGENDVILADSHELKDDEFVIMKGAKKMNKRKKIGMVKARSLSSLLGQVGS